MLSTEYQPSTAATLGMELEIQLIDKQTLDLAPRADEILHTLHQSTTARHFKQEVTCSMLELNSGIHDGSATLEAEMLQLGAQLCAAAAPLGIRPCGGGGVPGGSWRAGGRRAAGTVAQFPAEQRSTFVVQPALARRPGLSGRARWF